jgi:hypothetical protein
MAALPPPWRKKPRLNALPDAGGAVGVALCLAAALLAMNFDSAASPLLGGLAPVMLSGAGVVLAFCQSWEE